MCACFLLFSHLVSRPVFFSLSRPFPCHDSLSSCSKKRTKWTALPRDESPGRGAPPTRSDAFPGRTPRERGPTSEPSDPPRKIAVSLSDHAVASSHRAKGQGRSKATFVPCAKNQKYEERNTSACPHTHQYQRDSRWGWMNDGYGWRFSLLFSVCYRFEYNDVLWI